MHIIHRLGVWTPLGAYPPASHRQVGNACRNLYRPGTRHLEWWMWMSLASGNLLRSCYENWPSRNSGFSHEKWCFP